SLHPAAITFCAAAVTVGVAGLPARLTPFRLAHSRLLIEFLLADRERKHPATIRTPNPFVFHLGPRRFLSPPRAAWPRTFHRGLGVRKNRPHPGRYILRSNPS